MATEPAVRKEIVSKFQLKAADTGSPEVQVALLSERIQSITGHLGKHKKDHATRRGLLMLVGKRNTLLKYLARKSPARHAKLTGELGIR